MRTLNLGILAHVDAGKTSLTERLLYDVGVLDRLGSVDRGDTHTDSMPLERQRGITIRSAVVSFVVDDTVVSLIDTPGHSDFVAEVERALAVLDGAVLVVSAVEGVQAQTLPLMRALQRLRIPTLLFVNKVDRVGARPEAVLDEIGERLTPSAVALVAVSDAGRPSARVRPPGAADPGLVARTTELVAEHDDAVLASWLAEGAGGRPEELRRRLVGLTREACVHPVFAGSAITGAGADVLLRGVTELLPALDRGAAGPPAGTVFKVDQDASGGRGVLVRMVRGRIRVRQRVALSPDRSARVTGIRVFDHGRLVTAHEVAAGRIAQLRGLDQARIGDTLGDPEVAVESGPQFLRPTLEAVVEPLRPGDGGKLYAALTRLADVDPLIGVRQDDRRGEIAVSLYGEVQKEVIGSVLATDYGVPVTFRETTTVCIERVLGTGEAMELLGVDQNPFLATVGLRVAPAPPGAGVELGLEVELGSMPPAFFTAVEQAVRRTLREGVHGWEIPDCIVTVTRSGYWARQSHAHGTFDKAMSSTAGDFRDLTRLVLADALVRAETRVCEPVDRFELEVPTELLGSVLDTLARLEAIPLDTVARGRATVVTGDVLAAAVHRLQRRLPALTRGEGMVTSVLHHYRPVSGTPPRRPRTDDDPFDRMAYLRTHPRSLRPGADAGEVPAHPSGARPTSLGHEGELNGRPGGGTRGRSRGPPTPRNPIRGPGSRGWTG